MSRGERRTLRQILGSSACAAVLVPVEEDCLAADDDNVDDGEDDGDADSGNLDDANDEDLRNVAQKSHHVAEQVGLLREPLLTLRSELFICGAGVEKHMLRNLITLRKRYMPPPARNLSQLTGVSSVTFHIVDQAVSITSSQIPAWDKNSDSAKFFWAE